VEILIEGIMNYTFMPAFSIRLFGVLTVSAFILKAAAQESSGAHHPHVSPAVGTNDVRSLDVYADGGTIHLLLGVYASESPMPRFQYLRSTDGGSHWTAPAPVYGGTATPYAVHRGMDAQIAASGDNIVAVWTTTGNDDWGDGPLTTALSHDRGKTWQAGPNPADDHSKKGHDFIDIAAGQNGIFHLVWLDDRKGKRGLRYSQSKDGGRHWSRNSTLDDQTCECCWNCVVAHANQVYALYRDINPRDMAIAASLNNGLTWKRQGPVGDFDWDFNGCPHVGGGLAAWDEGGQTRLGALVWTGKENKTGLYYLTSSDEGRSWTSPHRLGDRSAHHADLAVATDGTLGAAWDAYSGEDSLIFGAVSHDGGRTWLAPEKLSASQTNPANPRVIAVATGFRVFWTESTAQGGVWKTAALANR
jgi:hypothetical protein